MSTKRPEDEDTESESIISDWEKLDDAEDLENFAEARANDREKFQDQELVEEQELDQVLHLPDNNPIIGEIIRQLSQVLGTNDVDELTKQAMKEALRESIPDWGAPSMSVVDGGKTFEDPQFVKDSSIKERRTQFQILNEETSLTDDTATFPDVQVRILSSQDLLDGNHHLFGLNDSVDVEKEHFTSRGQVSVESSEVQTLVLRASSHPYRVSCDQGCWALDVDSASYVLKEGQSMDVEGTTLSVTGIKESTGLFQLLK